MLKLSLSVISIFFLLALCLRWLHSEIALSPLVFYSLVRLMIFVPLLFGVLCLFKKRKITFELFVPSSEMLKIKTLSLRLGLIFLFLYPAVLSAFVSYPAIEFLIDYGLVLPVLLYLCPQYVARVEVYSPSPSDGYLIFGEFVKGRRQWCWQEQKPFILMWTVKLSFIPLMYTWLLLEAQALVLNEWGISPQSVVSLVVHAGVSADLLIGTAGYLFASRALGTEVKSTDSTFAGWLCCMICYPPFMVLLSYFKQHQSLISTDLIIPDSLLYWGWALLTIVSWGIYCAATFSFGYKFSNLSYRGLVSDGFYKYTKHPAYLSKNIYWWLCALPFLFHIDGMDALIVILTMSYTSFIYYMRAKTEEIHLIRYAEYAEYVKNIESKGLFKW